MAGRDIYDDILEQLQDNGDIDSPTFRRSVLLVLVDLGRGRQQMDVIEKKIDCLERNSLMLQAKKHLWITLPVLGFLAVFIISVIARLALWGWVFDTIGAPIP
jgi:hypothetical protein